MKFSMTYDETIEALTQIDDSDFRTTWVANLTPETLTELFARGLIQFAPQAPEDQAPVQYVEMTEFGESILHANENAEALIRNERRELEAASSSGPTPIETGALDSVMTIAFNNRSTGQPIVWVCADAEAYKRGLVKIQESSHCDIVANGASHVER